MNFYEISKVSIAPDDLIVVSTDLVVGEDWLKMLKEKLKQYFPNNEILVLTGGMKLSVIERTIKLPELTPEEVKKFKSAWDQNKS